METQILTLNIISIKLLSWTKYMLVRWTKFETRQKSLNELVTEQTDDKNFKIFFT